MSETKVSRRVFLRTLAVAGASVGAISAVGCGGGEEALNCNTNVDPASQTTRTNLAYVEASPHGTAKNCNNCNFYTGNATACGTCTLITGTIHPNGYCNSWIAKV